MLTVETHRIRREANLLQILQIQLIAFIFITLGILTWGILLFAIYSNPQISGPDIESFDIRIWNFLNTLGFLRPLLAVIAGFLFIRLGFGLQSRYIGAARWAKMIFTWLLLVPVLGIFQTVNTWVNSETAASEPLGSDFVVSVLPWGTLLIFLVSILVLVNRSLPFFAGDEDITSQRTRGAWTLLAPTLIIFLLIGITPPHPQPAARTTFPSRPQ